MTRCLRCHLPVRRSERPICRACDWVLLAACAEPHVDPDDWFPEGSSDAKSMIRTRGGFTDAEHRAKAVCARCPVREPCLKEGLSRPGQPGVWAGTTLRERRAAIAAGTTESLLEQMEVQAIVLGLKERGMTA